MKNLLLTLATISLTALAPIQEASAHVSYLDLINPAFKTTNAQSSIYTVNSAGEFLGNFGWADAADGDWGDSHHGGWAKFDITNADGAFIDLSVFTDGKIVIHPEFGVLKTNDLTPAFSIYSGVVPDLAFEEFSNVPADKGGAWNALGNTFMGNDEGDSGTITYLTHVRQDQNNLQNTIALSNYWLAQGTYSVVLGGDSALAAANPDDDIIPRGYGIKLTVTDVAAVPVPGAIWLMMGGLMGLLGLQKRKMVA